MNSIRYKTMLLSLWKVYIHVASFLKKNKQQQWFPWITSHLMSKINQEFVHFLFISVYIVSCLVRLTFKIIVNVYALF